MGDYDKDFFKDQESFTARSADRIVPLLVDLIAPQSVIDVGCAVGEWLAAFGRLGVADLHGVDGDYVNSQWLQVRPDQFEPHDLSTPYNTSRRYDLALCLEVAEHLSEVAGLSLVRSLTKLSSVVIFSAAVPNQGGVHHINEQWQDYWAAKFDAEGYAAIDVIRPRIWSDPQVRWWYAQNMLVYVARSQIERYPGLARCAHESQMPLAIVHPLMYAGLHHGTKPENMRISYALNIARRVCLHSIRRRLRAAK